MGNKAKTAASQKGATVQIKNDYLGYKRYGYRMPHGLVVTNIGSPIGIGETGSDGEPVVLPWSFIDMMPVSINDGIEFSHLGDVIIFAIQELVDRKLQLQKEAEEQAVLWAQAQEAEDIYQADKLPNQLPDDEQCNCDQCEGNCTTSDYDEELGAYKPDPGDAEDLDKLAAEVDAEDFSKPAGDEESDDNLPQSKHNEDCQCFECEHPDND